jgi:hypothetical protein
MNTLEEQGDLILDDRLDAQRDIIRQSLDAIVTQRDR